MMDKQIKMIEKDIDKRTDYKFIPGNILLKHRTCFLPHESSDTRCCFGCELASGKHGLRLFTIPLMHSSVCHGGVIIENLFIGLLDGVILVCSLQNGPPAGKEIVRQMFGKWGYPFLLKV